MNLLPFQGLFPKHELIASTDSFFSTTKFKFPEYFANGFFKKDAQESLYIYQIKTAKGLHTGIVCSLDINDFRKKVIPHEKTLAAKEQEQLSLLIERKAFIKPVLLAYDDNELLQLFISEYTEQDPSIVYELNKETHTFWAVSSGETIEMIRKAFKNNIKKVYVADGHHRCSTAKLMWQRSKEGNMETKIDSILCTLVPFGALNICDYNRIVDFTDKISRTQLFAKLSNFCNIIPLKEKYKPQQKFEITMIIDNEWYLLKWKKKVLKLYKKEKYILDYLLLNDIVFDEILGIKNVKIDPTITYVPGTTKLSSMTKKLSNLENGIGFLLFPVRGKELKHYADNKKALPPKSTYFEPRMLNALIAQKI